MTSTVEVPATSETLISTGFFKIWRTNQESKRSELVVSKPNTILYSGSNLMAMALGGIPNAHITHLYLGYYNTTAPANDYAITKNAYVFSPSTTQNYLRIPLTFPASFEVSDSVYTIPGKGDGNIVVFTILVKNPDSYKFTSTPALISGTSNFFEAGLVASLKGTVNSDVPLARVAFAPVTYDSTFNLSISWGVKIVSL